MSAEGAIQLLLWVGIALVAGYIVWQLVRLAGASRDRSAMRSAAEPPAAAPAAAAGEAFQLALEVQQLRRDLARLRADHDAQQQTVVELQAALAGLREQLDNQVTMPNVSPAYDEALVFARRGLAAEAIAERCGISMAEAQLVCSLARRNAGAEGEPR